MVKELIRNGGFELGNINFWESLVGVLEIEATETKYGAFAGKVIHSGNTSQIRNRDYIPVTSGELYLLSVWLKTVIDASGLAVRVYQYDSDLSETDYIDIISTSGVFDWTLHKEFYTIPEYVSYIRIEIYIIKIGGDDVWYVDSLSLQTINPSTVGVLAEELIAVVNETTKHTVNGEEFFTGIWKQAEYFLDVTSFTETGAASPVTLDVKIETYDPETEKWRDAMVFQQLSCAASGSETTQEYKSLSSNLGWKQRVTYTTAGAGTIGDCDFKVGVVFKR